MPEFVDRDEQSSEEENQESILAPRLPSSWANNNQKISPNCEVEYIRFRKRSWTGVVVTQMDVYADGNGGSS